MPSMEAFDGQPQAWKERVLPDRLRRRLAVEAGATMPWYRYVGLDGKVIGIDQFGASAPAKMLFEQFGFTVERNVDRAKPLLTCIGSRIILRFSLPALPFMQEASVFCHKWDYFGYFR